MTTLMIVVISLHNSWIVVMTIQQYLEQLAMQLEDVESWLYYLDCLEGKAMKRTQKSMSSHEHFKPTSPFHEDYKLSFHEETDSQPGFGQYPPDNNELIDEINGHHLMHEDPKKSMLTKKRSQIGGAMNHQAKKRRSQRWGTLTHHYIRQPDALYMSEVCRTFMQHWSGKLYHLDCCVLVVGADKRRQPKRRSHESSHLTSQDASYYEQVEVYAT